MVFLKLILLQKSCSFTFYTSYKIGMIGNGVGGMIGNGGGAWLVTGGGRGGTAVKMLKNTVVLKRIRNLFCKNL